MEFVPTNYEHIMWKTVFSPIMLSLKIYMNIFNVMKTKVTQKKFTQSAYTELKISGTVCNKFNSIHFHALIDNISILCILFVLYYRLLCNYYPYHKVQVSVEV
jgi:hypothetical protein